jgi:hypothetical protein
MSVPERADLYRNATHLAHKPEGAELKRRIEESGLPYFEAAALAMNDPISLRMRDIVLSQTGKEAALEATRRGESAMAGIDPLLQAALGVDYGPHNQTTNIAGQWVAELMRSLGYKNNGPKKLPTHCSAKSGETWVPKG